MPNLVTTFVTVLGPEATVAAFFTRARELRR